MSPEAWLPQPARYLAGLSLLLALVPPALGMEVMAPATINALNGTSVKLSCTFNSCYKVENKQFSLNWTYQECKNCSEELFLQFRTKIMNKQLDRFGNRCGVHREPHQVRRVLHPQQRAAGGRGHLQLLRPQPPRPAAGPRQHQPQGAHQRSVGSGPLSWQAPKGAGLAPGPASSPAPASWLPQGVGAVWADPALSPQSPRSVTRRWPSSWAPHVGWLPGCGHPRADGGEVRAPEKAAEAEHGRPEDGGGREDGRRRQPRRGHQVKPPARSLFAPVQRDPLDVLPRARICLPRASLLPSKRQPRLEQGTERRRAPQPGRGRERGWDCAWAGTRSALAPAGHGLVPELSVGLGWALGTR
uniref:Sodium voltage-gated channel beta subunit 2 n=1 Tax=Anas platyrhynchos TaxID=8839 RepID=A0A8B9TJU8_ANAPL